MLEVFYAINNLKNLKSAGFDDLHAESIKYAHTVIVDLLLVFFNLCWKHAYTPDNFCIRKSVRVTKKSNVCESFSNCRPTLTVKVLTNVLEYCLMNRLERCVDLCELQFGFTWGGGCNNALLVFKSVIE